MSEPDEATKPQKGPAPLRSPSFPAVDLGTALEKAETFRAAEGRNSARPEVAVTHWGTTAKSSGGKQMLATLRAFGLLEGEGAVKLTDSAFRILMDKREPSPEREALVRAAALRPAIHRRLWDRFGAALPSDPNLRHVLLFDEHFNENAVDRFIRAYKQTIAFAKLADSDSMSAMEGDQGLNPPLPGGAMPSASPLSPAPNMSPVAVPTPTQGVKQDVFSLAEGQAVLRWPENISKDSFEDFKGWLELVLRKVARSAGVEPPKP